MTIEKTLASFGTSTAVPRLNIPDAGSSESTGAEITRATVKIRLS
jgi:hypothetical protein